MHYLWHKKHANVSDFAKNKTTHHEGLTNLRRILCIFGHGLQIKSTVNVARCVLLVTSPLLYCIDVFLLNLELLPSQTTE